MLVCCLGLVLLAAGALAQDGAGYVNVRDFGAKGDGKTDDTPAIQKAIDALGEPGGEVYVPAGRYFLEPGGQVEINTFGHKDAHYAIRLPSNVTLRGAGRGASVFVVRRMNYAYPGADTVYSGIAVIRADNVLIEKIGIVGEDRPAPAEPRKAGGHAAAIDLRFATNVVIRDCDIRFTYQGVTLFGGTGNILIESLRIDNCGGCAVAVYGGAGRTVVSRCGIANCGDGTLITYANNGEVLFSDNRVEAGAQGRTQLLCVEASSCVKVTGNHLEGGFPAIDVKRARGSVITGNTLRNCLQGIVVRAGDHAGAAGYNWRTTIADNSLEDFPTDGAGGAIGIRVSAAVEASVTGNLLSNIDGFPLSVTRYAEFREGNWPLSGRGICVANNIIVRRVEEHAEDPATGIVVADAAPTPLEAWDPFDPASQPPARAKQYSNHAISISGARNIAISGNVIRGGGPSVYPYQGAVAITDCKGFTFSGNSIGDGNIGRGVLISGSTGAVLGNSIEAGGEYALRLDGCSATTVSGNQLDFRSQTGVGLELDGASTGCVVSANNIASRAAVVREHTGAAGNTFLGNRGTIGVPGGEAVSLNGVGSLSDANVWETITTPAQ
jgi:hypothetical protein